MPKIAKKKMGRPITTGPTVPIGLRLPPALVARLDAYADEMASGLWQGMHVNRTDVIRRLLLLALDAHDGTKGKNFLRG